MSGNELQYVGHDYVHVAAIIVLAQVLYQRKYTYIEHWAGTAARLSSWRKMTQPGEFCW